jgi:hypothetical protein
MILGSSSAVKNIFSFAEQVATAVQTHEYRLHGAALPAAQGVCELSLRPASATSMTRPVYQARAKLLTWI